MSRIMFRAAVYVDGVQEALVEAPTLEMMEEGLGKLDTVEQQFNAGDFDDKSSTEPDLPF